MIKGGHTFRIDDKVCLQCHKDTQVLMLGWKEKLSPTIKQLKDLLDSYSNQNSKAYIAAKRNYTLVVSDGGVGIHNPRYAQELLQYSISLLRSEEASSIWGK